MITKDEEENGVVGIIVNPVSGGGKGSRIARQVCEMLEARGENCRLFETEKANDGARQACLAIESGCHAVACIGGDGTLSEIADVMAGSGVLLYVVPCGTGNDFARAMGLPLDPLEALRRQIDGVRTQVDCGSINGRAFLNVSGSGFDVEVLRKTEEFKQVYPGPKAYSKAVIAVLSSYRSIEAEISIDGGTFVHQRCTIAEVANGRFFGGGMMVAPGASLQDGMFDLVTISPVPRFAIPFLLPLFRLGIHIYLPIARVVKAKEIVLRSKDMVVNIDGRLEEMDEARYTILPGALTVMLPK